MNFLLVLIKSHKKIHQNEQLDIINQKYISINYSESLSCIKIIVINSHRNEETAKN